MRIAFISYWSCPLTRLGVLTAGGMNVYLFNLANQLQKQGVKVDIYTRSHQEKHESVVYLAKNIRLIHLPAGSDHYRQSAFFAGSVFDYLKKENIGYDLIHSHYYFSGLIGLNLKNKLMLPLVHTFHTLGQMKKNYAQIDDPQRIEAETMIARQADILIASTILEKNDLIKFYQADSEKVNVISPGVDHNLFAPLSQTSCRKKLGLPNNVKIILFVGRIDPIKGISLLLEAVYRTSKKQSEFKQCYKVLLIGGDIKSREFWKNPEVKKIQDFIKEKNLEHCADFLGNIAHNQLPVYYGVADLVVLPSVYESFGLVILEAMASGRAVLASKVAGINYLISDNVNGQVFTGGDIEDLSQKLMRLMQNDSKRKIMGKNAFLTSQDYTWEKQAAKILFLYRRLVKN